jgi:3-oxocholest-4-en-26-oyl-CoA dehydrogenase alpha subunit
MPEPQRYGVDHRAASWVAEVQDFLAEHVTAELLDEIWELGEEGRGPHVHRFQRAVIERGWFGLSWPTEFGGMARSAVEQLLLIEQLELAGVPSRIALPVAVTSIGPTILRFGTEDNKRTWLPSVINGDVEFALGYSEPDAGSDLASLRTKAVLDGDEWVINGQKTWNTGGHASTHEWLAVRTDPNALPHKGISLIVVPTDAPGVDIRPLWTWGDFRTNEVFFTDVRVPSTNLIGSVNEGWRYIMAALDFERVNNGTFVYGVRKALEQLARWTRQAFVDGQVLAEKPSVRRDLAQLDRDVHIAELLCLRTAQLIDAGEVPTAQASMSKVLASEVQARLADVGTEMQGLAGQLDRRDPNAPLRGLMESLYRQAPAMRFVGGTNELQRTLIATRGLGVSR